MKEDIRKFARLGFVHQMLYPRSIEDPGYHVESLTQFISRNDVETFDCCFPFGKEYRNRLIQVLKNCGKEFIASIHLTLMKKVNPSSVWASEQGHTRLVFEDQIKLAGKAGASGFIFGSGPGSPDAQKSESREAFSGFTRWFCSLLKQFGIKAVLEPFDTTIDKRYLYGPTIECVDFIRSLEPEIDNLGINLDFAHIPLMFEDFAHAVRVTAPCLKRVHLGNCVLKDTSSPWYGDKHPPIGFEGGEIDIPELSEQLRLLLEDGYLNREKRAPLVMEMQPFPGLTAEETIADTLERLEKAWDLV
ncbi:sugar phosphate isomerase/epimerase family protein [Candidatus Latescibacterota bacterium]